MQLSYLLPMKDLLAILSITLFPAFAEWTQHFRAQYSAIPHIPTVVNQPSKIIPTLRMDTPIIHKYYLSGTITQKSYYVLSCCSRKVFITFASSLNAMSYYLGL